MRAIFFSLLLAVSFAGKAQDDETIREYIETYKDIAMQEMQRTGVPASIKLAQGIHETMAGTSVLVQKSNNHFGIKCKSDWKGESVSHTDDAPNECFRKYSSALDSYRDHSDFLKGSSRYASLFKLNPLDYEDWAYGLKKAGYATNPRYPQVIIKLIEDYHLQDYTLIAMGKMLPKDELLAKNTDKKQEVGTAASSGQTAFINDIVINIAPEEKKEMNNELVKTEQIETKAIKKDFIPDYVVEKVKEEEQKPQVVEEAKAIAAASPAIVVDEKPVYPSGEFRINETRVVYAKKGTPFLALAEQYKVSLAWIFQFNDDMKATETVESDQLIYLQRKRRTGNNEFHIVKEGETLRDIARDEAIRLETLMEYNSLGRNSEPAPGEQLYLRTKAPAPPRLAKQ